MNYVERRRAAWRTVFRVLGVVACVVAACALVGCAGAGSKVADFFGGLFSSAAPVADAAGQPWLGSLLGWAGKALLAHPYETAGATLAGAVPVKHYLMGGIPGTRRHRDSKAIKVAKRVAAQKTKAQMRLLDADTEHRKVAAAAEAKVRRAVAKKNAALIAANQHVAPQEKEA